jgi:hypothetical protein
MCAWFQAKVYVVYVAKTLNTNTVYRKEFQNNAVCLTVPW